MKLRTDIFPLKEIKANATTSKAGTLVSIPSAFDYLSLRFTFRPKLNLPIPLNVTSEINSVNLFI